MKLTFEEKTILKAKIRDTKHLIERGYRGLDEYLKGLEKQLELELKVETKRN